MAEREATIVIKYVSDTSAAKADYDALRKYAEANPVGARMNVGTPGLRASDAATFGPGGGGGTAPSGVVDMPRSRPVEVPAGQVGLYQAISRMHSFGGSGFGPAVGPLPTAGTNTFWGDTSRAIPGGSFSAVNAAMAADQMRALAVRRAVDSGSYAPRYRPSGGYRQATPFGTGDDFEGEVVGSTEVEGVLPDPVGSSAPKRRRSFRNLFRRSGRIGNLHGLGTFASAYGIAQIANSVFSASNQYQMGQAAAGGDPYALAQNAIANDPYTSFARGIPIVGDLGANANEFLTGDRAAATRTLVSASLQDQTTQSTFNRYRDMQNAKLGLRVAQAGLAGTDSASIAAVGASLAKSELDRQSYVKENGKAADDRLTAANKAVDNARGQFTSVPGILGSIFGGDIRGYAKQTTDTYKNALAEQTAAQQAVNQVGTDAQKIKDLSDQSDRVKLAAMTQGFGDATTLINATTAGRAYASNLTRSGYSLQGAVAGVNAEFDPKIAAADKDIARIQQQRRDLFMQGADRSAQDAAKALLEKTQAEREGLVSQQAQGIQAASDQYATSQTLIGGDIRAGQLRLGLNPYAARTAELTAQFQAATRNSGILSPEFATATAQFAVGQAQNLQNRNFAGVDLASSLGFEGVAQKQALARNPYGAQYTSIAGRGVQRIRDIFRSGLDPEGKFQDQARQQTLGDIDLADQQIRDSFRGRQSDFQNILLNNQRDGLDPESLGRDKQNAKDSVTKADPSAGAAKDGKIIDYTEITNSVAAGFDRVFGKYLQN